MIDEKDRRIIDCLIGDARASLKQIGEAVDLSPPSVADRLRRLEACGVIRAYTVDIDPKALGYDLEAVVRIKPMPGKVTHVERLILDTPEITECDKITGDDCFVARLCVRSIEDIDRLLDRIGEIASTSTSLVKRKTVKRRTPPLT